MIVKFYFQRTNISFESDRSKGDNLIQFFFSHLSKGYIKMRRIKILKNTIILAPEIVFGNIDLMM
jgi:hypothetical protein